MPQAPRQAPDFATASDFSRNLGIVLGLLAALVAARFRVPGLAPFTNLLWRRITRVRLRVQRLMALLAAGCLPRPRKSGRGGGVRRAGVVVLPRGQGWLVGVLGWEAAGYGSQLATLLADPAVVALLAQVPAAARLLRPITRMLTVVPSRPPRPARAAAGGRSAVPPGPPQYPPFELGPGSSWYGPLPPARRPA